MSRGVADLVLGDFVETIYPPPPPGHYIVEARDQASPSNVTQVTFDVDSYLVHASSKSLALYSEAANTFQTRLTLNVKTAKPLTTLEFRLSDPTPEGLPRFPLVHRFPPLGNSVEFEASLPQDLAPGRYVAVGYAADGVRFASSIDLLDRTTAFAFAAGLTGEERTDTELTPVQNQPPYTHTLALSKAGQNFVPSGEFKSGVYDLDPTAREGPFFDTDFLGGVVIPGNIDPTVAPLPAGDLCGYGLSSIWSGASPGSVDGASPSGEGPRFTLGLRSDVEPLAEQPFSTVVTGQSVFDPFTNCPGSRIFPVKRFVQFKADLTASTAITDCGPTGTNPTCQVWPAGAYSPYDLLPKGFVARANSARYEPTNDPLLESELPAVLDGDEVLVDIPGQGFLRFFNVTMPGDLTVTCGPRGAPPGFVAFPPDRSCNYATTAQFTEVEFHLKFDPTQFTPEQLAQLKIIHVTDEATGAFASLQASVVDDTVVGRTATLSPFFIALPVEALVRTSSGTALTEGGLPEAVLKSRQGYAPVAVDTSAPPLSDLIAAKAALGYSLISGLYRIADDGTAFLPPAELLLRYSTGALGPRDLDALTPGLMELDTTPQQLTAVSGQTTSTESATTLASLPAVHGLVGVFARPNDRAPPATRVLVAGNKYESPEGLLFISRKSSVGFEAADTGTLAGDASGLSTTYFLLDPEPAILQGGLNAGNAHNFQAFAGPAALTEGVHAIAYGSADRAGNFEAARSSQIYVDGTPPSASLSLTGPAVLEPSRLIVGPQTFLSFTSLDPVSNGVSAGTAAVAVLLDQTPQSCGLSLEEPPAVDPAAPPGSCANPLYGTPFAVPAGTHSLTYMGVDNVLNAEVPKSTNVVGDYAAPSVVLQSVPQYTNSPRPTFRAAFSDALAGLDVSSLTVSLDGAPLAGTVVTEATTAWRSGPPLPTPVFLNSLVYSGGFLYNLGGNGPSADYIPEVSFARIGPDGAPSTWTLTAPLPGNSGAMGAAAFDGRIYLLGNFPGARRVLYAQTLPQGGVSGWAHGPDLPLPLFNAQAVALAATGGALYAIGGQNDSNVAQDKVYRSTLTAGVPGEWTEVRRLDSPLTSAAAAALGGRIYVMSGTSDAQSATTPGVWSAAVDGLGDLDAWRREADLPVSVQNAAAVAAAGRVYFLGGRGAGVGHSAAVFSAAPDGTGALAAWRSETALPEGLAWLGLAAGPAGLYVAGGAPAGSGTAAVRYALFSSGEEAVRAADVVAAPSQDLQEGTHLVAAVGADRVANAGSAAPKTLVADRTPPIVALTSGGDVLTAAGPNFVSAAAPEFFALVSDTGNLSGVAPGSARLFLDGTPVGEPSGAGLRYAPTALATGAHTLSASAADRAGNAAALTVAFVYDPLPPELALLAPAPGAVFGAGPVALEARLSDALSGLATGSFALAVGTTTYPTAVQALLGSGELEWDSGPVLPKPVLLNSLVYADGTLYSLGGNDPAGAFIPDVAYSRVGADGIPGTWQQTTPLLGDSGSMGAAVLGGRIYLVGNFPGAKRVLYAKTVAQGPAALEGGWQTGLDLPEALFLTQAVGITAVGPYLYVIGGQALGNAPQSAVYRSALDTDDGSPIKWETMLPLPEAMTHAAATTLGGRIYVLGGTTDAQQATNPHVWSTAVNGDGSLAEWKKEPDLPIPLRAAQALAGAGRVYFLGGHNDRTGQRSDQVWSAAPGTGTLLDGWRVETALPEPIAFHGAAASPAAFYVAGGAPAGNGTDAVRFARLSGINPVYSVTASAAGLGEGPHEARASGADLAGNTASASATFHVDLTAPVTALELFGDFRQVGTTTYALPGLALRLSATDYPLGEGGAGVAASYLSTGAAVFALPGELVLEPGFYTLSYASVDRVGNFGSTGTAAVKVDAVPPGAPQSLAGKGASSGTVTFAWAVQGDDDGAGDFADAEVRLDVRTADAGFSTTTARVVLSSGPLAAGAPLSFAVGGLAPETTYYAAAFARDAAGNWSGPSNVAAAATPFLAQSADAALSLYSGDQTAAVAVVPVAEATGAYTVAIASAFEPVLASFYDLDAEISSGSTARLVFVLEAGYDLNSLAIYTLTESGWTSDSIVNQEVVDLGGGLVQVSGDIFHTSLYAVLVRDTAPPRTAFAPAGNSVLLEDRLFTAAPSSGVLSAVDRAPFGGRPSGVTATLYALDGGPEQAYAGPFALAEGRRNVSFRSVDKQGNAEPGQGAEVFVDASAPILDISLDQPTLPIPEGFATLSATAVLTLSALDPEMDGARAGLAEALYVLDGATTTLRLTPGNASAGASIPLGTGLHVLVWRAEDRLGHVSERRLRIAVGDAQAPALAFRFPHPGEPGLCRLAQGPVAVRGTVFDENITSWNLTQGTVLLGSGTANAAGVLGTWDATGQSGPLTLTLAAEDVVANAASLTLDVQAGQPARSLALGGKQVLNKPRGVAAGPNRVYVADTNADAVRVFDAAGTALAVLGGVKGPAKLNKPAGLALDAAGNILVADANNKRVVKLSPAGALLAEYGKGDLQRPVAVALSAGRIAVADAKAGQLLLFSDAGALLVRVDLPPAPGPDEDLEEPRPAALAADAAGNVWVADAKGARVLRYGPNLSLAQTIPGFERPEGVAVSPSGTCLAVSDTKAARIRTFDAELSAGLAAFGQHGEIKPFAPLPAEPLLNKPAQLAFTAQGTLLVADRNNDLIQGFGLPGASAVVAMGGRPGKGTRLASADDDGGTVASARVGRFEGGRVEHPDGAAVEIPGGAIAEDLDVAVGKAADSGDEHRVREAARGIAGLAAASAAREFSPHGLTFSAPAVITLPYDPLLVAAPRELKIHYWNAERSAWEALASDVDEGARTVSARVAHFSVYQILGPANTFGALADPEAGFAFRASYAFPNPAVGGQKPTVHVAVGKADKVTLRFYDIAGTPVHEATLDAPSIVNDDSGPHWAYEYAWAGHIPSGVYLYAVTAEKAGHAPIRRIGRLAVVR